MKRRYIFGIVLLLVLFLTLCATAGAANSEEVTSDTYIGSDFSVEGRMIRISKFQSEARIDGQTEIMTIPMEDAYCIAKDDTVLIREVNGSWCNGAPSENTALTIGSDCEVTAGSLTAGSKVILLETDGKMHAFSASLFANNELVVGKPLDVFECINSAHFKYSFSKNIFPLAGYAGGIITMKDAEAIFHFDVYIESEIYGFSLDFKDFSCEINSPNTHIYNFLPFELETAIPLTRIAIPLPGGFALDFSPTLSLQGSGTGTCDFAFNAREGLNTKLVYIPPVELIPYSAGWNTNKPSVKMQKTELDGEVYYGFSWGGALSWKVISIGPSYKAGISINSKKSKDHFDPDDKEKVVWHACNPGECYEGQASLSKGPFSVSVTVGIFPVSIWDPVPKEDYPFTEFYTSKTYQDSGTNMRCPHKGYRLDVDVYANGQRVPGAEVSYRPVPQNFFPVSVASTRPDSKASVWVPEGPYTLGGYIKNPMDPTQVLRKYKTIVKSKKRESTDIIFSFQNRWIYFNANIEKPYSNIPPPMRYFREFSPSAKLPDTVPQKEGFAFLGWNTRPDGRGQNYAPGSTITSKEIITYLYGQWKIAQDSWYIVYNANGGETAPLAQIIPNGQDAVVTDEIAWWDSDIYFKGWSTEPDAIYPQYKPGDIIPYQKDVSFLMLYAVWEFPPAKRPVEIRYDANGVDGASLPATIWVEPYTWIELGDALPPFGSDVQFLGWSANSSAAEPEYTAGQAAQFGEDTVLYAVWYSGAETVTLSFRDSLPGEVSGMPDDITILPSQSPELTIPDDIPEKPGYYFTGWNTAEDGNGTRYAPGSSFTLKVDTILYAQWQLAQNSWYILFNANGGVKAPLGQVVPKGQDAVLTDEIAEWDSDIYFRGWSTEPDAINPEYKPGDKVSCRQDVSFLTLYAVWEFPPVERPVEIRFDANGADGAEVPRRKWIEPYSWLQLKAAIPPIGGEYTFLGWDRNPNVRTPSFLAGDSYQFSEDTVLYAIWAKGQDTATLAYKDSLEGTVSGLPDPITINPSMSPYVRIPDNIPQKVGMVFTGWNTEKDGSGEGYAPGSIITVTEDTILYAQWTPLGNYWYIVYNANGGSDAPLTQLVQKGQDAVLELQRPRHDTWIFLGWSRDRNAAKPEYQPGGNLPYDSSETFVTLYAVWYMPDSRTVTVSFDANGGDAGTLPGPISVPILTWFPLPEKTPAWDPQHDFLGWDPKPKAAEPAYKAGDVVMFTKDTVLYAVWNPHYRIIQGAGSNWVKDSGKEHRFAADGNIAYFREFRFDGKALDSSEYKATSGSTIIDVSAAAMQKLSVGKHTVEVVYQDGSASAEFTVSKKIPKTGDTAELLLWNGLVLLGIAGLVFVMRQYHSEKRKKK